jgi:hypothetical protein
MKKDYIKQMQAHLNAFGDISAFPPEQVGKVLDLALKSAEDDEPLKVAEVESVPTPAPAKKATKAKAASAD